MTNSSASSPRHWIIIPAAGVGARMAADRPKQYLPLVKRTVIEQTISRFASQAWVSGIWVGLSDEDAYWDTLEFSSVSKPHTYRGGAERADTVLAGLEALSGVASSDDWVWVHDAARPCLSQDDIDALLTALPDSSGAILAAPIYDTIKRGDEAQKIVTTVDRSKLWRALTPQVFRYADLKQALVSGLEKGDQITDEASAMELVGRQPLLVEGSSTNIKITRPGDLELAAQYSAMTENTMAPAIPRIGSGFDVHAFEEGHFITLCGIRIPHTKGLKAHSDGDVALHALMDAMLGAVALGDIGKHFPDTDEKWKGADSRSLLKAVAKLIAQQGYELGNADLTIIAERPKMSPHIGDMRACIAEDLSVAIDCVSVKATTSEKLGFCGREEGIAVQASVLLLPVAS